MDWKSEFMSKLEDDLISCPSDIISITKQFYHKLIKDVEHTLRFPDIIYWNNCEDTLEIKYILENIVVFVDSFEISCYESDISTWNFYPYVSKILRSKTLV